MKNKKRVGSRVERYSTKNRLKRRIKKNLKNLPKNILKNIIYLIIGLGYAIYLIIRWFDNLIVKLFMKLPRFVRAIVIWVLIISSIWNNFGFKVFAKEIKISEQIIQEVEQELQDLATGEINPQIETKQEEEYKCTLEHETACKIKKKAEEYGIDWKIAVSISAFETGYWTSDLYNNKNNVGGLYCRGFLSYETLDEGIEAFVSNLKKNYFDMGLNTLELIKPKYCPDNSANDPNNLNQYWLNGTTKIYNSLEG